MANAMMKDFYMKSVSLKVIGKSLSSITLDIQVSYTYSLGCTFFRPIFNGLSQNMFPISFS